MQNNQKFRPYRMCPICKDNLNIDFKNVELLKRFMTDSGKIIPRRYMRICAKHQRKITREIKRARQLALLPFVVDISN